MLLRRTINFIKDPVWFRVCGLSLVLFFVLLGDAILSYWVPNYFGLAYKSPAVAGLIISFSSFIGLMADLALPQLVKGITVRRLMLAAIFTAFIFAFFLYINIIFVMVFLSLLAMAVWGIYYELIGFAQQQFVAETTPLRLHSGAWGILSVARNLAYFLGPLLGSVFLQRGYKFPPVMAILVILIGLLLVLILGEKSDRPVEINIINLNILTEAKCWITLISRVWPILAMSFLVGLIDSFFWSVGAIWNEILGKKHLLGGLFLPFYTLPALFVGFLFVRWKIFAGKKKLAIRLFLISALLLLILPLSLNVYWQLAIVLTSSLFLALVCPLIDGVYSDIIGRMDKAKYHMIGLTNSTTSISYIIGPALAGIISVKVGEPATFSVVAGFCILVLLVLLAVTPKKLKVPQTEIKNWN